MNKKYKGVIPPIITPVDAHECVDEAALRVLIRHCIEVGMHGIFVAGTNGEAMALCPRERERAIKITLDECGEKIPVLCGIMDSGTGRVIENLKRLEQLGGKAAVVTPVFYAKHAAQGEFLRHYEAVSRSASCDILIYNIPAYTGACLKAEDVFEISKMEHISGYKDSSGNLQEFISCTEHFRNTDFSVLQGVSGLAAASMLLGADGMVPSLAPAFPEIYLGVYEAGRRGDAAQTSRWNRWLMQAQALLQIPKSALAANKCVMSFLGYSSEAVLRPTEPVSEREHACMYRLAQEICDHAQLPARFTERMKK